MSDANGFTGFPKETVRFFTALRKNNNRDWFAANKETYERRVIEPAKLFVTAMGERLRTIVPGIVAVPAVNKSIFRIYRDTRFSLDPAPYKTNLGIYFWDGARSRMESAGFYVGLEPPDIMLGGGLYMIPDNLLGRYRRPWSTRRRAPSWAGSWPPCGPSRDAPSRGPTTSACRPGSTPPIPTPSSSSTRGSTRASR